MNSDLMQIAGPFLAMGGGVLLAAGFVALLRVARGERLVSVPRAGRVPHTVAPETVIAADGSSYADFHDGPTVATPIGAFRTGWRYCPEHFATVAVYLHRDGTATCADDDCHTHIPATEGD